MEKYRAPGNTNSRKKHISWKKLISRRCREKLAKYKSGQIDLEKPILENILEKLVSMQKVQEKIGKMQYWKNRTPGNTNSGKNTSRKKLVIKACRKNCQNTIQGNMNSGKKTWKKHRYENPGKQIGKVPLWKNR